MRLRARAEDVRAPVQQPVPRLPILFLRLRGARPGNLVVLVRRQPVEQERVEE